MNYQKFFFISFSFLGICLVLQVYTLFLYLFSNINLIAFIKSSTCYLSIIILNIVFIFFIRKKHILTPYFSNKEAIFIASFIWLMMIGMGLIPYLQFGYNIIDALFESSSGFSTTGSTIIIKYRKPTQNSAILAILNSMARWNGSNRLISVPNAHSK